MTASFPAVFAAVQEMERRRIAGDLHDSIGQSLSAVCFGLGAAAENVRNGNVADAGRMLDRLATQVKQTIEEVRRIALDLKPAMLEDVGLVATLSWLLREFRSVHQRLDLSDDIGIDESGIAPGLCVDIYRVAQEALTNVARHSRASRAHVGLCRTGGELCLEVADNGIGLASTNGCPDSAGGLGLTGMRERVRLMGGRVCIVSVAGQGTRVVATWPAPGA